MGIEVQTDLGIHVELGCPDLDDRSVEVVVPTGLVAHQLVPHQKAVGLRAHVALRRQIVPDSTTVAVGMPAHFDERRRWASAMLNPGVPVTTSWGS